LDDGECRHHKNRQKLSKSNDHIREHIEAAKLESLPGGAFAELESGLGC
jgi:hypothetical protein